MGIFDFLFGPPNVGKLEANKDVEGLIKALEYNKSHWVRESAAVALGKLGDPKAVDPLINALKNEFWDVRWSAATLLGKLGDPKAVDPLITALKDKDCHVRESAAVALGKLGDPKAVDPLINALKDREYFVCDRAAAALEKLGDPKAVDPLINALKDEDRHVREIGAELLGEIGDVRAVEPLIQAISCHTLPAEYAKKSLRGDVKFRVSAAKALGKLHRKGCTMHIEKSQILKNINYKIEYSSHEDQSDSSDCPSHDDLSYGKVYEVKSTLLEEDEMEW